MEIKGQAYDWWIVSVSSILLIPCVIMLYDPGVLFSEKKSNLTPIGKIHHSGGDVRRRTYRQLQWTGIGHLENIFSNDGIYVGPNGSAEAVLTDQSKIHIAPSSLVFIDLKDQQSEIKVESGDIYLSLGKAGKASVRIGKKSIVVGSSEKESSKVRISNQKDQGHLEVIKGNVRVAAGDSSATLELKEKQVASTTADKELKMGSRRTVELVSPTDGQVFWNEKSVSFEWKSKGEKKHLLEIGRDPNFSKVVFSEKVGGSNFQFSDLTSLEGTYYWRISEQSNRSPAYQVFFKKIKAPEPTLPLNHSSYFLRKKNGELEISLHWNDQISSDSYRIQIAKDKKFKSVHLEKVVEASNKIKMVEGSPGIYYWRVKSIGTGRPDSPWSEVKVYTVNKKKRLPPPSPKNEKFETSFFIKILNLILPNAHAGSTSKLPVLRWNHIGGAVAYKIEISRKNDFSQIAESHTTSKTEYSWQNFKPGRFYWRVAAIDVDGDLGDWSPATDLEIQLAVKKIEVHPTDRGNLVKWDSNQFTDQFEFEVADNPDFLRAKKKEVSGNKVTIAKQDKPLFFRVRATDELRQELGPFSRSIGLEPKKKISNVTLRPPRERRLNFVFGSGVKYLYYDQSVSGTATTIPSIKAIGLNPKNIFFLAHYRSVSWVPDIRFNFSYSSSDLNLFGSTVSISDPRGFIQAGFKGFRSRTLSLQLYLGLRFYRRFIFQKISNAYAVDNLDEFYLSQAAEISWRFSDKWNLASGVEVSASIIPFFKSLVLVPHVTLDRKFDRWRLGLMSKSNFYSLPLSLKNTDGSSAGEATVTYSEHQLLLLLGYSFL